MLQFFIVISTTFSLTYFDYFPRDIGQINQNMLQPFVRNYRNQVVKSYFSITLLKKNFKNYECREKIRNERSDIFLFVR